MYGHRYYNSTWRSVDHLFGILTVIKDICCPWQYRKTHKHTCMHHFGSQSFIKYIYKSKKHQYLLTSLTWFQGMWSNLTGSSWSMDHWSNSKVSSDLDFMNHSAASFHISPIWTHLLFNRHINMHKDTLPCCTWWMKELLHPEAKKQLRCLIDHNFSRRGTEEA